MLKLRFKAMDMIWSFFNRKKTVLIIEDDPHSAFLLREFLRMQGYRVLWAISGEEGLEMVRKQKPNLVLLDIMLPHMSGYEVLQTLRSEADTRGIPVVMSSVLNSVAEIEKCGRFGADAYLSKPFDLNRLSSKVQELLKPEPDTVPPLGPPPPHSRN